MLPALTLLPPLRRSVRMLSYADTRDVQSLPGIAKLRLSRWLLAAYWIAWSQRERRFWSQRERRDILSRCRADLHSAPG